VNFVLSKLHFPVWPRCRDPFVHRDCGCEQRSVVNSVQPSGYQSVWHQSCPFNNRNKIQVMKKATSTGSTSRPANKAPAKRANKPAESSARATSTKPVTSSRVTKAAVAAAKASPGNFAPAAKKPAASTPVSTVSTTAILARIDVGFGNLLYIRGEGPGLSWDRGAPMECASSDTWTWSTTAALRPFAYKVIINDEQWSVGDDYIASVGVGNTVWPAF